MNPGATFAIVPVKGLDLAKSRLSVRLDKAARRRLVLAMLEDVLSALRGCPSVARTIVVTPDQDVAKAAAGLGAEPLVEEASGDLNGAINLAVAHASAIGAARVLVVPADVPLATPREFATLLATAERTGADVALTPSHDGSGTNALVLTPPGVMAPSFGLNSCQRHLTAARSGSLARRVVELAGLGFDVDEPGDLDRLLALDRYSWLKDAIQATQDTGPSQRPAARVSEDKA
jgi:2-phospho-L-lactate guanylyltransferase